MRKAAAPPPPRPFSGAGSGSSSVSAEDSDSVSGESLEGRMELTVYLPGEKIVRLSVERRTPMMDLLVQVTKANNLSPVGYILKLTSDNNRDAPPYKPSTAIGSLSCNIVYVVPKSSGRDSSLPRKDSKAGSYQPFEKTFRLRVHLPRNQLHVLRVSPNTPLVDVYRAICVDRELVASKYELRHPIHREERLDPQRCLTDYGLSEVAVVAIKEASSGLCRSSSDIMALQHEEDRKKRGFFGFMFKKTKSSIGDTSSDGHSSRGVSPARSDNSEIHSISPPPSTVEPIIVNRRVTKKKAPPPPSMKPPAPKPPVSPNSVMPEIGNGNSLTTITHSRNSSDSSGYHEASILSDSPDSGHGPDTTDSRPGHPVTSQSQCKTTRPKGPAPSNLTLANSTSSLSVLSTGPKKRKAPVPPSAIVSPVSAPPTIQSTPSPPPLLNHSFTYSSQVSALSPDSDNGDVAISPTTKLTNAHAEIHVNGNGHSRSSSISSRTSSTGEEIQQIVTLAPPQPVPRQSKTPVLTNVEPENQEEFSEVNKELVDSNANENDNYSYRRTSTNSTVSDDIRNEIEHSPMTEIDETAANFDTERNYENDRRSSHTSSISHSSKSSSVKIKDLESISSDHERQPDSEITLTAANDSIIDSSTVETEVVPRSEVSVQTNFDLEHVLPPHNYMDETDEQDVESQSSSRNSSVTSETSLTVKDQNLNIRNHPKGGQDFSDFYDQVPDSTNDNTPYNLNDYHNQFNLVRRSITSRWGRLVSLPHIELSDLSSLNSGISESDEEQDLPENGDETLSNVDDLVPKVNDDSTRSLSIDSSDSWRPQFVGEQNTLDINARLDLEAAIEKVFASVDESEETVVHSEVINDNFDTWEYTIPEVPPPPQFDNNYLEETDSNSLIVEDSLPDVVCEVPPEFQNTFPELEKEVENLSLNAPIEPVHDLISDKISVVAEELSGNLVSPDPSPVVKELPIEEAVIKEIEVIENNTKEEMATKHENVEVRRVYRKPVVQFSIATYKARDSEEVSYQNKLAKSESFSVRTNSDIALEPKVTKYESSSLPRTATFKDKSNIESISGQSKAIANAIAVPVSVVTAVKEVDMVIEVKEKEPENSSLRRTKSEMQLDNGLDNQLNNTSQLQTTAEQEKLKTEYQKLHEQFLQWQQQLMQNQAVLQQQKIAPESTTETLQRIQDLQQQFSSLPPLQEAQIEVIERQSTNKLNYLSRPKSEYSSSSSESSSNTNSLERRPPRIGPKPWRPASVSITAWNSNRLNSSEQSPKSVIIENIDKVNNNFSNVTTNANGNVVKDKSSTITVSSKDKPVVYVNRNPPAQNFPRWPVVKGFVLEPQPKSKVVLNSEKIAPQTNYVKPTQSTGSIEVKIASANAPTANPPRATIEIENKSNREYVNGSAFKNNVNNRNQSMETNKKFTTVVNLAQRQQQTPNQMPPPPPPPPPPTSPPPISPPVLKPTKKPLSFQRSTSSNGMEDGRDELMTAIKDFGGRSGLRKVSSSDTNWQQRYGNDY